MIENMMTDVLERLNAWRNHPGTNANGGNLYREAAERLRAISDDALPGHVASTAELGVRESELIDLIDSLRAGYVVPDEDGGAPAARTEKEAEAADMLEALHRGLSGLRDEFRCLYEKDSSAGYKKWDAARMKVDRLLTSNVALSGGPLGAGEANKP